jgi:hypothetical protein
MIMDFRPDGLRQAIRLGIAHAHNARGRGFRQVLEPPFVWPFGNDNRTVPIACVVNLDDGYLTGPYGSSSPAISLTKLTMQLRSLASLSAINALPSARPSGVARNA